MGQRIDFLCIGDRLLGKEERFAAVKAILDSLSDFSPSLTDVMVLNVSDGREERRRWIDDGEGLVSAGLAEDDLLFVYFDATNDEFRAPQSLSFYSYRGKAVAGLSLCSDLFGGGEGRRRPERVLCHLAAWSMQVFDHGVVAYGPELDLYELGKEAELDQMEGLLAKDWRTVGACSTRRFRDLNEVLSFG